MTARHAESLSVLMDGEANELELRRLLKAIEEDASLSSTWERYHLVQAIMHDEPARLVSPDLSKNILAAIEQEPALDVSGEAADAPVSATNWMHIVAKTGIAASVAVALFVVLQSGDDTGTPEVAQDAVPNGSIAVDNSSNNVDPVAQQRLRDYIQQVAIDPKEPESVVEIQESPLFHLVNEVNDVEEPEAETETVAEPEEKQ